MSNLVTVKEVSAFLGVAPKKVYDFAARGVIPSVHLSARCLRFDMDAVKRAVEKRMAKANG